MTKRIQKVLIVGGGTAGWLTANHLGKHLCLNQSDDVEVTLIESPNIPTIGVGEGTVPMMRQSLHELGISETEFIQQCDVTFKQGIKFVDWLHNPGTKSANYYHHIFDYPTIKPIDLTPYWLTSFAKQGQSYVDTVAIQGLICDRGLAPKTITTPEYQGHCAYAYHLDAGKFAKLLTKNATEKLGVKLLKTDVLNVNLHEDGAIKSVMTDSEGEIVADFFIDCTGFNSLLIGKALQVPFIDKSNVLFADHAVVMQVPYLDTNGPIPSYTVSTAMDSGWVWDIGLTERRGVGHVYSSAYTSHEEAEQTLRQYVGAQAEHIVTRKIEMNVGYREKFWQKNCVAIGLSQGFVEPLEATGLLVFDATAKMLAQQFPTSQEDMPILSKQFNQRVRYSWDKVIDFIKLHYCTSKRTDSQFWLDNRDSKTIPDSLNERLELWQRHPPSTYDFFSGYEIFNLENYLYVLYGMEYETNLTDIVYRYPQYAQAKNIVEDIKQQAINACQHLPTNRELIEKIKQYGLQKL